MVLPARNMPAAGKCMMQLEHCMLAVRALRKSGLRFFYRVVPAIGGIGSLQGAVIQAGSIDIATDEGAIFPPPVARRSH